MKRISNIRNIVLLTGVCCMSLLSSCKKEETTQWPTPMSLIATLDRQAEAESMSRSTVNNMWEGMESVAVQIGSDVKEYRPSMPEGILRAVNSADGFYWQNTNEVKTVSAWCPYSDTRPTTFTIQTDQRYEGCQQSDLIHAAPKEISPRGNQEITFKHLLTKVVINLKAGRGVPEDDVRNATISILNQPITTGEITYEEGPGLVAEQTEAGSAVITPNVAETPTKGYLKTLQAILVPQQMVRKPFIQVTINTGVALRDYYYTPEAEDAAYFKSGTQNIYNITVQNSTLFVEESRSSGQWGSDGSENITSKRPEAGFSSVDLKIGDYYYSDGETSDGGYRKYTDQTTALLPIQPVLKNSTGTARSVLGIVFWVGDIKGDNYTLLDGKFPSGTKGLAVSLQGLTDPDNPNAATMTWTNTFLPRVSKWLSNATWQGGVARPSSFTSIQVGNKTQGYANTLAIRELNNELVQKDIDDRIKPIYALDKYAQLYPAPAKSSGWYWPSVYELRNLCWGQGMIQGVVGRDLVNQLLGRVSEAAPLHLGAYWSSSEYDPNALADTWVVNFELGGLFGGTANSHSYRIRPILAF